MKMMPKKGDTVCTNGKDDATVLRVVGVVPPTRVGFVDASRPEDMQNVQWTNCSLLELATHAQLQNAGLIPAGTPRKPRKSPALVKVPVSLKLPRWLLAWMDEHPDSREVLIEDALKQRYRIKPPRFGNN